MNWDWIINYISQTAFPNLTLIKIFEVTVLITAIGVWGIISNRRNFLMTVVCVELMYYGLSLMFLISSLIVTDVMGQIAAIFIITLAGAESALSLALLMTYYRSFKTILFHEDNTTKYIMKPFNPEN